VQLCCGLVGEGLGRSDYHLVGYLSVLPACLLDYRQFGLLQMRACMQSALVAESLGCLCVIRSLQGASAGAAHNEGGSRNDARDMKLVDGGCVWLARCVRIEEARALLSKRSSEHVHLIHLAFLPSLTLTSVNGRRFSRDGPV
jgi:hypothetical protein